MPSASWNLNDYVLPDTSPSQLYLQDQKASEYEWNYAYGLERRGLEYIFQYDIMGGRMIAGGFIIDFMVLTTPLSTPVWIHGEYWHQGKQKAIDEYQQSLLKYTMAGEIAEPIIHFGAEVATPELGLIAVRKDFG